MKIGGRGVLPFVVGLGAAAGGYVMLRRVIPPPSENVTKPEPSPMTGLAGGVPPGPVADEEPNGFQSMLEGFIDQFGQPTEAEAVTPPAPGMRFEDEQQAPAPAPRAQVAAPARISPASPAVAPSSKPAAPYTLSPWAPKWIARRF